MMTTGIIRKIDDLGRIAIPKEMRRVTGVYEGDPLEICITEDGFCLKKVASASESSLKIALNDWLSADCEKSLEAKSVAIALQAIFNKEKTEKKKG